MTLSARRRRERLAALLKRPCDCLRCAYCCATGRIVRDADEPRGAGEPCPQCNGTGIAQTCERCREMTELASAVGHGAEKNVRWRG